MQTSYVSSVLARTAASAAIASATTTSILWLCLSLAMRQPRLVSIAMARLIASRMPASG